MNESIQEVAFQKNEIHISYPNYGADGRNYGELFDFLADYDIITASEIGQDAILMSSNVYLFSIQDEFILRRTGQISLSKECSIEDYIDKDNPEHQSFLKWYL